MSYELKFHCRNEGKYPGSIGKRQAGLLQKYRTATLEPEYQSASLRIREL